MKKYIDKTALVAEVERRQKIHFNDYHINGNGSPADYGACNALTQILDFINTLEVKEVGEPNKDLEDDVDKILEANDWDYDKIDFYEFAKHFFELGLKVQKGE